MKFSEKLYQLRKKQGLSQEELGEKLNVTRQTVSKWELGQTKPETDKLLEISALFNVSLDELTNDNNIQENNNSKQVYMEEEQRPRKWLLVLLIIIAIIIVIVLVNKVVTDRKENKNGFFDRIQNIFTGDSFNRKFEFYVGTKNGVQVGNLLDEVITNNKTNNKIITVKYGNVTTSNGEEIKNLKSNFDVFESYEISLNYDEKGNVNEVIIEKNDVTPKDFNKLLEFYSGSTHFVSNVLDLVMNNSNNYELHTITVVYKNNRVSNNADIRDLKNKFDNFKEYEVWFEYDAAGYINVVNIEDR